jgi:catechol 2,3-dioxygenase-like lactoylglutathione lyase family enzyme
MNKSTSRPGGIFITKNRSFPAALDILSVSAYNTSKQKGDTTMATYKHDHTHITTPEPDKIIEFYTKVMGARVTKEIESAGRRLTDIDLGGIPVRISSATGADKDWKGPRYGLHHLGLEVDNMDEFIAKMKANSVEIVTAPFQPGPGVKAAFIKGPDGVLFEIIEKS